MSAILVAPSAFTVLTANQASTALASNLRLDEPAMVWRSTNLNAVSVTVQLADATPWDTVCLVGSNLRASDTIRVVAANTQNDITNSTNLTLDQTFAAWSGTAPTAGALSFRALTTPIASGFVRITITSNGNPAGYVQASRLVIGKRIDHDGVNPSAEQTYEDTSIIEDGPGYTTVDRYSVRLGWKVTLDGIKDAAYFNNWHPFLRGVGKSRAFVFIPDDSSPYVQAQALFCRVVSSPAKGSSPVADFNIVEFGVLSVG